MTDDHRARVDAVAQSWASIDVRLDQYERERDGQMHHDHPEYIGSYLGYTAEAEELIRRLEKRGFSVVRKTT